MSWSVMGRLLWTNEAGNFRLTSSKLFSRIRSLMISSSDRVRSSVIMGTGLEFRSTWICSATSSSEFLGRSVAVASPIYIHSLLETFSCSSCLTCAWIAAFRFAWVDNVG